MVMEEFLKKHSEFRFDQFKDELSSLINRIKQEYDRPHIKELEKIVSDFPDIKPTSISLDTGKVKIGEKGDSTEDELKKMNQLLLDLNPWRKGPFDFFGIDLDTEWRSDLKWDRIIDHISDLSNRRVLDIGCSSGYYMFKMTSLNPEFVLGIDPYHRFYYQYQVLQKYIKSKKTFFIPARFEEFPVFKKYFDTIFFMGILYHRKSPIDTLSTIHKNLKKGGELVLETLIIDGDDDTALFPVDRYAKMRNVFFIPTVKCLTTWLQRTGFENIRCIDVTTTTLVEQRRTKWVNTESLEDFIDPDDPNKTIEGYPAPVRAVVLANAK
ncbi:MAG: tRNA 5-methoxyuridine(34)/uridine 5-oxyacetic acid(34) synthase CmoB [Desulfobacterales bacterium]|nr:tRNA 5-methoxyuridine(34)/uridine 5-oxyacetic acid(34) synthase CmoB [Desulfobacterales bacterium]MCP4163448.1 tRNA 5-methoxyuridine(34)/uridine 5-oxyacetic acid(34) synthase CmoB [Deltaproteobacteria bacterium]